MNLITIYIQKYKIIKIYGFNKGNIFRFLRIEDLKIT